MPSSSDFPSVAAVVPTRNRKEKTLRFLKMIQEQTYPNLRVIAVDAHSTDGTPEAIRQAFPEVVLLQVSDRHYWAAATNAGVRQALQDGFDYIFTVNDDSVFEPTHLERLIQVARQHGCLILGNQINYLEERDRIWSLGTYSAWGTQNFLRLAYYNTLEQDLPEAIRGSDILETDSLPGNGVLIQRHVFEQVGLYNDVFLPHYHADSEFIMRARRQQIPAFVCPGLVLYNDFSESQKKVHFNRISGILYTFFHKKSHLFLPPLLYIFFKYCPLRQQWKTFTALVFRLLSLSSS